MNTPDEYAMEEFYDQISRELYPEHKEQAIEEFTEEKLKLYYLSNPEVMRPAVLAIKEANWQLEQERFSAALIHYVTAIEILLKATLLRPVLIGLIHNENLAEIMVKHILGQTGIVRYKDLISKLFNKLTGINFTELKLEESRKTLFAECEELQIIRNKIIHQGTTCLMTEAVQGKRVSEAVYQKIVFPMLNTIGLTVIENGVITEA